MNKNILLTIKQQTFFCKKMHNILYTILSHNHFSKTINSNKHTIHQQDAILNLVTFSIIKINKIPSIT